MLPLVRPCASVVTIHDVIGLAWKEDVHSRIGRLYYRCMISTAVRLADRIITDSEFSRSDIIRRLGVDPKKITVIYPGISSDFYPVSDTVQIDNVRARYGINNDYLVYAGIYKPRKNHAALLQAFKALLTSGKRADLVLVGPLKEGHQRLAKLAEELGIGRNVIFAGHVSDHDLRTLYSGAKVYVCPSLYEGFGFTVLEAMACGAPVVSSAATSLKEIGGDAALYADPTNTAEFAEALCAVFENTSLRRTLIEKGKKNVLRFSWANTAKETFSVYSDAVRNPL